MFKTLVSPGTKQSGINHYQTLLLANLLETLQEKNKIKDEPEVKKCAFCKKQNGKYRPQPFKI